MEDKIKILLVSFLIVMLFFFFIGCEKCIINPISTSADDVSVYLSALPKKGSDERFSSIELMHKCQNDMEQIAKALSMTLKESQIRSILKEELKNKDAFWEISFNQLMSNEISNDYTIFDLMVKNGVSDFAKLLKKYPDLRLSIPEKYEDSFDPLSDFNVAVLPVEDERYVKEIISFDFQGKKIVLDPVKLCDIPLLVLEIDENPDNHPTYMDSSIEVQIPQYQDQSTPLNLFNVLSKTTTTVTKVKIYKEYLNNKLEGTLSRAEFNVTVTVGNVEGNNDYVFPTTANRGFGITEVNSADTWYSESRWIWDYNPGNGFGPGKVLGICLWEDDTGGEDKLTYYSADQIWGRTDGPEYPNYNHGYLDVHESCPDDLYGYVFLEWWDLYGATGYNGVTKYAYGYNSNHNGNEAYQPYHKEYTNLNATVKFKLYDE